MSEQRDTASVYGRRDRALDPQRNAPSETARRTDGSVECKYMSISCFYVTGDTPCASVVPSKRPAVAAHDRATTSYAPESLVFPLLTSLADIVFPDDLPTERELQAFSIRVEMKPGVFMPIGPVKGLECPIVNCLPPSGPYYDEFILKSAFGEVMFDLYANGEIRVCIVYWGPKHEDNHKRCTRKC